MKNKIHASNIIVVIILALQTFFVRAAEQQLAGSEGKQELTLEEIIHVPVGENILAELSDANLLQLAKTSEFLRHAAYAEHKKRLSENALLYWADPKFVREILNKQASKVILPPVRSELAFSPDGTLLATKVPRGIALWDIQGNIKHLENMEPAILARRGIRSLRFSSKGSYLFVLKGGIVNRWDIAAAKETELLRTDLDLWHVAENNDGTILVSGIDTDHTVHVVHIECKGDTPTILKTVQITDKKIQEGDKIALSPDGQLLVFKKSNGFWMFDTEHGKRMPTLTDEIRGIMLAGSIPQTEMIFSPDSKRLVIKTHKIKERFFKEEVKYAVKVFDMKDGTISAMFYKNFETRNFEFYAMAVSQDNSILALAYNGSIDLWNLKTSKIIRTLDLSLRVDSMAFSPDNKILALSTEFGNLCVYINRAILEQD